MNTAKIRVFICDDHALFRDGLKAILREEPDIDMIGDAKDGREAVEQTLSLKPDVVLMDVEMPDMNGFEATRRITQADRRIKVLILTMYQEEEVVARCLDAGASGYVLKDASASQLMHAIETVHRGGKYLSPGALQQVVTHYLEGHERPATTRYDTLSAREREIFKLLADGLSVKEIAARLGVSVKTVDVHKYNLMRKLDIHDRAGLIKYAIQRKLIRVPTLNEG
jgi:two-component system, NarL family, response regulator NreC